MQLANHELQDLNDLIQGCASAVTCMGLFINHTQDPDLKAMLMRHLPLHVAAYNQKVAYLSGQVGEAQQPLTAPPLEATMGSFNMTTMDPAPPVMPRTSAQNLDDREIAAAYLVQLKRSGREYAWAAMEISHPDLRVLCEELFRTNSHQAHEVWQYMASRGYYPVRPAPERAMQMLGGMFLPVTDEVGVDGPMGTLPTTPAPHQHLIEGVEVPRILQNGQPYQSGTGLL